VINLETTHEHQHEQKDVKEATDENNCESDEISRGTEFCRFKSFRHWNMTPISSQRFVSKALEYAGRNEDGDGDDFNN
jgi:hypothetical protein